MFFLFCFLRVPPACLSCPVVKTFCSNIKISQKYATPDEQILPILRQSMQRSAERYPIRPKQPRFLVCPCSNLICQ
ncbi:hypothetical protein GE21DRAFT_1058119 [Neurospora crassa]|nr:hypothetical protein GE21DRAFT_1058119 [Neurospora crassa]